MDAAVAVAVAAVCTHTRGHYRAGRSKQKGARKANIIKKKTLPSKAKVSLPSSFSLPLSLHCVFVYLRRRWWFIGPVPIRCIANELLMICVNSSNKSLFPVSFIFSYSTNTNTNPNCFAIGIILPFFFIIVQPNRHGTRNNA